MFGAATFRGDGFRHALVLSRPALPREACRRQPICSCFAAVTVGARCFWHKGAAQTWQRVPWQIGKGWRTQAQCGCSAAAGRGWRWDVAATAAEVLLPLVAQGRVVRPSPQAQCLPGRAPSLATARAPTHRPRTARAPRDTMLGMARAQASCGQARRRRRGYRSTPGWRRQSRLRVGAAARQLLLLPRHASRPAGTMLLGR